MSELRINPKFGDTIAVWVPDYNQIFPAVVTSVKSTFCLDATLLSGPANGLAFRDLTHEFTVHDHSHPCWYALEQVQ